MTDRVLTAILLLFSAYALLKFAFFFVLRYESRRRALDKAYRDRSSATAHSDLALFTLCILLAGLLAARGSDSVSFLTGLLVGMTLIQLYFHRFSQTLDPAREPPEPRSPIKWISYAIQDEPARAWKELLLITLLLGWSVFGILS